MGPGEQQWGLDLYCGEGGATRGYQLAGFRMIGVDNRPMPRYVGDEFIQADALDVLADRELTSRVVFAHASPPCQRRSRATLNRERHPEMIGPTRAALMATGLPWIMENVPPVRGSEWLAPHIKLCACQFPELPPGLVRERWFETWPMLFDLRPPCQHDGPGSVSVNGKGGRYNGSKPMPGLGLGLDQYVSLAECKRIMGIDWMTQRGLGQALPPIYTHYLGGLMRAALAGR